MTRLLQRSALPAFLLLCLVLGGSSQGVWTNAALQLLAALLLAWVTVAPAPERISRAGRLLGLLVIGAVLLALAQLVPLPPSLWTALPGREPVAAGYALLGQDLPFLSLSMSPYESLAAAYALIPPVAVLAGMLALRGYRESWVAGAILLGAFASIILGAVQVVGSGSAAWAYFYRFTNTGAVGFFANRNHMATLLVAALPFAAAMFASGHLQVRGRGGTFAMLVAGGTAFILVLVGLLLNSSLAAIALAAPVVVFSALIPPAGWRWRRALFPLALVAVVASAVALASASGRASIAGSPDLGSLYSRGEMWETTLAAISNSLPFGTGLGTFAKIYVLHENPAFTDATFINHAHNDYLELLLETGIPGLLLLIAFLAWWGWRVAAVWRAPFSSHFAKAATIASAAILAHSIVDYPLRAAAIAAVLAACLAMMAQPPRRPRDEQPRHVRIA